MYPVRHRKIGYSITALEVCLFEQVQNIQLISTSFSNELDVAAEIQVDKNIHI